MNIASQYHDYENCSINMTHDLGELHVRKREICHAFTMLLDKIRRLLNSHPDLSAYSCLNRSDVHNVNFFKKTNDKLDPYSSISVYEKEASSIEEQRNMLRNSQMKVENDLTECDNPNKAELLENILEYLRQAREVFFILMKKFQAVKEYE
jgi:hypothetical protein